MSYYWCPVLLTTFLVTVCKYSCSTNHASCGEILKFHIHLFCFLNGFQIGYKCYWSRQTQTGNVTCNNTHGKGPHWILRKTSIWIPCIYFHKCKTYILIVSAPIRIPCIYFHQCKTYIRIRGMIKISIDPYIVTFDKEKKNSIWTKH